MAAATNAEADPSDDLPGSKPGQPVPDAQRRPGRAVRLDPRDRWILEQRPPHWD